MSYCSIHTFEISRELSGSEYYLFKDHFYKMGYKIRNNNGNLYIFDFTSEGIRIRLLNNEYFNKLCIIVNLKEVIDNGNLCDIIHRDEAETAFDKLTERLCEIIGPGFKYSYYELSRIDFCTNLQLEDADMVKCYLKIFNRKIGKRTHYTILGINAKRGDTQRGFCAVHNELNTELAIYDKNAQLEYIKRETEAEKVQGVLRIEYRLTNINAVDLYTDGISTIRDKVLFCIENSRDILYDALSSYEPAGTYLTLEEAIKRIDFIKTKKPCKFRAMQFLYYVSKRHSIKLGKKQLQKEDSKIKSYAYHSILDLLEELNINAVTLGRRDKYSELPNLYYFLANDC